MNSVTCQISISLDGFVAGPNQSLDDPIGEGGMRLHQWVFQTDSWRGQHGIDGGEQSPDSQVAVEMTKGIGAYIMGRNMFGGGNGAWDETWTGWWGEDVGDPKLDPITVVASPAVTHVKYRVVH